MSDRLEGLTTRVTREAVERKLFGDVAAPARLRDYTLLEHLGSGGMGDVFVAYDPDLDRRIAIKVLRAGGWSDRERELYERRLVREARAMAKLAHPNVNAVHQVGTAEGRLFIAMEYIGGGTLRAWLGSQQRTWQDIVQMFAQAGEGLCAAHDAGLIHRDFKPDNVLVGEDGRARVTDFGLVVAAQMPELPAGSGEADRAGASTDTFHGLVVGTPAYMAPEQLAGEEVDRRTDIYAFCVALYEGLYGELPFPVDARLTRTARGPELARTRRDDALRFPDSPEVPQHVREVLARGLHADPAERFESMRALLSALLRDPWRTRRRALAIAGAVAIAGALAVLAYLAFEPRVPACQSAGAEARQMWSPEISARIASAFAAVTGELGGSGIADAALARVNERMPEYSGALARAYRRTCEEPGSVQLVDLVNRCLDYRLAAGQALIAQLQSPSASAVLRAASAVDQLPVIGDCSNPALVQRPDLVNRSEEERTRLIALETGIAEAEVQISLGRYGVLDELEDVVEQAGKARSPRVLGRAELARTRAHAARGWNQNARLAGRAALASAERAADDATAIGAMTLLIPLEYDNSGRATVYNLKRLLDAKIARVGGSRKLELASELAWLPTLVHDRAADAYALARTLLPQVEEVFGDPSLELGGLLVEVGSLETLLEQHDRAAESLQRAIAILAEILGSEHPTVAEARANLADVYFDTSEPDKGLAQLDLVDRHLAKHELAPSRQVKLAMRRARLTALVRGREDEALAILERALTIRGVGSDGEPRVPRWEYARVMETRAEILFRLGRLEGLDALIEESIEMRKKLWVPGVWLIGARARQIHLEIAAGTCGAIRQRLAEIAPLVEGYSGSEEQPPSTEIALAHCDLVAGKRRGVTERLARAIAAMKERGNFPLWRARAEVYLARLLARSRTEAETVRRLAESARPILEKANDRLHLRRLEAVSKP